MRLPISILIVFLICSFQKNSIAQTSVGLKAGVNLANVFLEAGGASVSFENNLGIVGGLVLERAIGNKSALQAEILFTQKGFKTSIIDDLSLTINYIDVPLLYKMKFGNGSTRFFALGGVNVGYAISGNSTISGVKEKVVFDGDYERIDFGMNIGAGLELGSGKNRTFLELRYQIGLTGINDQSAGDGSLKNKGLSLSFGLFL